MFDLESLVESKMVIAEIDFKYGMAIANTVREKRIERRGHPNVVMDEE